MLNSEKKGEIARERTDHSHGSSEQRPFRRLRGEEDQERVHGGRKRHSQRIEESDQQDTPGPIGDQRGCDFREQNGLDDIRKRFSKFIEPRVAQHKHNG